MEFVEMKNIILQIKISLQGIKNNLELVKEMISEIKSIAVETPK